MSHSLSPLRQVYDLGEPPPGRPDGAAAVEGEMLAQMRRLLEAAPRSRPEPAVLAAVEAHAHAALPFAALRGQADASVEAELLRQSAAALGTLPAAAPGDATLAAVLARAAEASAALAPVRAAYALTDAPADSAEATLLADTRRVLDRAWTAQRPSPEAVDAVLARAASWSAESVGATTAPSVAAAYGLGAPLDGPEAAVVAGSAEALGRLPVYRPSGDALAAVFAAAAAASAGVAPTATARPAIAAPTRLASRDPARPAALWARRPAIWGGAFATLLAVVVAFGVTQNADESAAVADAQEVAAVMPLAAEPEPPAPPAAAPAPAADALAPSPSAGARALAAGGPMAGLSSASALAPPVAALAVVPPTARRTAAEAPSLVRRAAAPAPPAAEPTAAADLGTASLAAAAPTDDWDAVDDVRLLSLRLQELRRKNQGLEWDEPAEAFGAPAASALSATPGLQSVGVGSARSVPRARALMDTTLDR